MTCVELLNLHKKQHIKQLMLHLFKEIGSLDIELQKKKNLEDKNVLNMVQKS